MSSELLFHLYTKSAALVVLASFAMDAAVAQASGNLPWLWVVFAIRWVVGGFDVCNGAIGRSGCSGKQEHKILYGVGLSLVVPISLPVTLWRVSYKPTQLNKFVATALETADDIPEELKRLFHGVRRNTACANVCNVWLLSPLVSLLQFMVYCWYENATGYGFNELDDTVRYGAMVASLVCSVHGIIFVSTFRCNLGSFIIALSIVADVSGIVMICIYLFDTEWSSPTDSIRYQAAVGCGITFLVLSFCCSCCISLYVCDDEYILLFLLAVVAGPVALCWMCMTTFVVALVIQKENLDKKIVDVFASTWTSSGRPNTFHFREKNNPQTPAAETASIPLPTHAEHRRTAKERVAESILVALRQCSSAVDVTCTYVSWCFGAIVGSAFVLGVLGVFLYFHVGFAVWTALSSQTPTPTPLHNKLLLSLTISTGLLLPLLALYVFDFVKARAFVKRDEYIIHPDGDVLANATSEATGKTNDRTPKRKACCERNSAQLSSASSKRKKVTIKLPRNSRYSDADSSGDEPHQTLHRKRASRLQEQPHPGPGARLLMPVPDYNQELTRPLLEANTAGTQHHTRLDIESYSSDDDTTKRPVTNYLQNAFSSQRWKERHKNRCEKKRTAHVSHQVCSTSDSNDNDDLSI